jgi:hypothetical protein
MIVGIMLMKGIPPFVDLAYPQEERPERSDDQGKSDNR